MEEGVKKSDLVVGDPIDEIRKDLDNAAKSADNFDEKLRSIAKTFKSEVNPTLDKTVKGINAITQAEINSEKLFSQKIANEKKIIDLKTASDRVNKIQEAQQKKNIANTEKERLAEIKLQQAREKAFDDYEKKLKREQAAKEKANKAAERAKKIIRDEANAYNILTKETNHAQAEFKRLAAQHGTTSKEALKAKRKFDALDKSLRRINKEAKDGRRDVGRYATAWRGAQSALGAVGVSIGIGFAGREGLEVLEEYDEKIADIRKTTGLNNSGASAVSSDLLKLDTKTSITNLQELVEAGGRLNITGRKNLVDFAAAADEVFVALGDDLEGSADEIATNIGKISAQFGLEGEFGIAEGIKKAGSGINELSAKSKASAPNILNFTNRMIGLSDVLELTDVQAMGALFDEAGQSIEVAATTMNKLLPSIATDYERFAGIAEMTPEAFKKIAEESPVEALKLVAKGAKNSEKGLFSLTSTLESYGIESARAVGIVGTLTNNVDRLTELQGVSNEAIDKGNSLTDEFNIKNETLSATVDKVKNKFVEQWLAFTQNTNAANGLKTVLNFVAENLGTIISVGAKVVRFFLIYKTITKANQLLTSKFGTSVKGLIKGFKNLIKGGKGAIATLKGIGKALKGIVFGIALELLIESAAALWDIASGAKAAREALESLERANENAANNVERIVNKQSESFNKRMKELDLEIRTRIANGESEEKLAKEKLKREEELTKNTIESLKRTKKFKDKALAEAILDQRRLEQLSQLGSLSTAQVAEGKALAKKITGFEGERSKALKLVTEKANRLTAESIGLSQSIGEFNDQLAEKGVQIKEQGGSGSGAGGSNAKAKERISLLRQIQDVEIDLMKDDVARDKKRAEIAATRADEDLQLKNADEEEKARLTELIYKKLQVELDKIDDEADKARRERDAQRLKDFADKAPTNLEEIEEEDFGLGIDEDYSAKRLELLLDQSKSEKQIEEELSAYRIELLEREIATRKLLGLETQEFEIELAELRRKKEEEDREKWLEASKKALDNLQKAALKVSDERIKAQEDVISSEEKLLDDLQQKADQGILEQGESVAAQQEKVIAAQEEKVRMEKQKQTLEFATAAISTFSNAIEQGKTVPEALGDVALSQAALEVILNTLPKFIDGSNRTVAESLGKPVLSGEDGYVVRVDGREKILNPEHSAKTGNHTTSEIADIVNKFDNGSLFDSGLDSNGYMQMLMMPSISIPPPKDDMMLKKLDSINARMEANTKAIQNLEFPSVEMGRVVQHAFSLIDKDGKGNSIETVFRNSNRK